MVFMGIWNMYADKRKDYITHCVILCQLQINYLTWFIHYVGLVKSDTIRLYKDMQRLPLLHDLTLKNG